MPLSKPKSRNTIDFLGDAKKNDLRRPVEIIKIEIRLPVDCINNFT